MRDARTGAPLSRARISLEGEGREIETNSAGLFALGNLLPGRYLLTAHSPGYGPARAFVEVTAAGASRVALSLDARPFTIPPLIVDGTDGMLASRRGTVEGEGLRGTLPTEGAEAIASQSVLGISRRPLLSDIRIQGGESGEHQLRLDSSPLYNPISVEGLLGTLSPLPLDRITVQKAGFPARAGSAIAGIVDLEQGAGSRLAPEAEVRLDPFSLTGRGSVPLRLPGGWTGSAMVGARTTLWGLFRPPMLERSLREWNALDPFLMARLLGNDPDSLARMDYRAQGHGSDLRSRDLHLTARVGSPAATTLSASFHRGENDLATELLASAPPSDLPGTHHFTRFTIARDSYRWRNTLAQLRMDRLLGARGTLSVRVRGSSHIFRSGYELIDDPLLTEIMQVVSLSGRHAPTWPHTPLLDRTGVKEFGGEVTAQFALPGNHHLHLGGEVVRTSGTFGIGLPYIPFSTSADHLRMTLVTEDRWRIGNIELEGGIRASRLAGGSTTHLEPRGAITWEGDAGPLGPALLRIGAGLYHQFVNQFEVANPAPSALAASMRFWLPAEADSPLPTARHLSVEGAIRPHPEWEIRGEAYRKVLPTLLAVDHARIIDGDPPIGPVPPSRFIRRSEGRGWGWGLRVERETDRWRIRSGYDRTHAKRTIPSRFDGDMVPSPVDTPHRLLSSVEGRLFSSLTLRIRGHSVWGRGWAFRRAYYDLLPEGEPEIGERVGRPGEHALPALHEVDLGVSWHRSLDFARVEFAFDIQNALGRRNVLDYGLRRGDDEEPAFIATPRHLGGVIPLLTLRVAF